jgi:orotidine-5'-phosphate decarboxylase
MGRFQMPNESSYTAKLKKRTLEIDSRLCVGVDPHFSLLGTTSVKTLEEWVVQLIENLHESAAAFKFQFAFFQQFGVGGLSVLSDAIELAKSKGAIAILDAKYADIPSTFEAYISTAFGKNLERMFGWNADAVTVNPYLALEAMRGLVLWDRYPGHGYYVLMTPAGSLSPNISEDTQRALDRVTERMLKEILTWTHKDQKRQPACLGVVVSAIRPDIVSRHHQRLEGLPLLVPGIGFQGGSLSDFARVFSGKQDTLFVVARSLFDGLEPMNFEAISERASHFAELSR